MFNRGGGQFKDFKIFGNHYGCGIYRWNFDRADVDRIYGPHAVLRCGHWNDWTDRVGREFHLHLHRDQHLETSGNRDVVNFVLERKGVHHETLGKELTIMRTPEEKLEKLATRLRKAAEREAHRAKVFAQHPIHVRYAKAAFKKGKKNNHNKKSAKIKLGVQ